MRIVSIGEILWDVFNHAEFLGGAPLNFSAHSQRLGNSVALVSAVGDDARGERTLSAVRSLGLSTDFVQKTNQAATGVAEVTIDASGNASFHIDRPSAYDFVCLDGPVLDAVSALHPQWVYFGTLAQAGPNCESQLLRLLQSCPSANRFYDLNLRTGHWDLQLVERLCRITTILKLNETEAEQLFHAKAGSEPFTLEKFCRYWSHTYQIETICLTLGSRGCAVFTSETLHMFPGISVKVADTVGAGDAFAAAFLHGYELGWPLDVVASTANRLGAIVASRQGATPAWTIDELRCAAPSGK